jgi:hypothetical protein
MGRTTAWVATMMRESSRISKREGRFSFHVLPREGVKRADYLSGQPGDNNLLTAPICMCAHNYILGSLQMLPSLHLEPFPGVDIRRFFFLVASKKGPYWSAMVGDWKPCMHP